MGRYEVGRLLKAGQHDARPDRAVKSLQRGVMRRYDLCPLSEGGAAPYAPWPCFKTRTDRGGTCPPKIVCFYLPHVLQAGLGVGGHHHRAVSRFWSGKSPAGMQRGCYCLHHTRGWRMPEVPSVEVGAGGVPLLGWYTVRD